MGNPCGDDNLDTIVSELIGRAMCCAEGVREGTVMTAGPPPYRRIDCDGRALAYIRARPRKGFVRVDISGLWLADHDSPLRAESAGGAATLIVYEPAEVPKAIDYLRETVERTREAHAKRAAIRTAMKTARPEEPAQRQ